MIKLSHKDIIGIKVPEPCAPYPPAQMDKYAYMVAMLILYRNVTEHILDISEALIYRYIIRKLANDRYRDFIAQSIRVSISKTITSLYKTNSGSYTSELE